MFQSERCARERRDGRKVNASCTPWENKPDYQHNYAQITAQRTGRFSDLIKLSLGGLDAHLTLAHWLIL
jgi:hypothetical protein